MDLVCAKYLPEGETKVRWEDKQEEEEVERRKSFKKLRWGEVKLVWLASVNSRLAPASPRTHWEYTIQRIHREYTTWRLPSMYLPVETTSFSPRPRRKAPPCSTT